MRKLLAIAGALAAVATASIGIDSYAISGELEPAPKRRQPTGKRLPDVRQETRAKSASLKRMLGHKGRR